MNWDSQLGGIVIGSGIALVSNIIVQWVVQFFANQRQQRQFIHDLDIRQQQLTYDREVRQQQLTYDREVRQEQFAHDREQEIRGRRTAALGDLVVLLEDQVTALQDLGGFLLHPDPNFKDRASDAWRSCNLSAAGAASYGLSINLYPELL